MLESCRFGKLCGIVIGEVICNLVMTEGEEEEEGDSVCPDIPGRGICWVKGYYVILLYYCNEGVGPGVDDCPGSEDPVDVHEVVLGGP